MCSDNSNSPGAGLVDDTGRKRWSVFIVCVVADIFTTLHSTTSGLAKAVKVRPTRSTPGVESMVGRGARVPSGAKRYGGEKTSPSQWFDGWLVPPRPPPAEITRPSVRSTAVE